MAEPIRLPSEPAGVPPALGLAAATWTAGHECHSGDEVFRITFPASAARFVKASRRPGALAAERDRIVWLHGRLPVPEVVKFAAGVDRDWLVLSEVPGLEACDPALGLPRDGIVRLLARGLRQIHDLPMAGCPFQETLTEKISAAARVVESRDPATRSAFEKFLTRPRPTEDPVASHGDYCEPNVLIHRDRIGGFIDLGNFAVTDRCDDFGQMEKSLRRNGHGDLVDLFFTEYGLPHWDRGKIDYYQTLAMFFG